MLLARRENVGQPGWAHDGIMIQREYDEIVTERDRIWATVASVASGEGIGGMAAGEEEGR